MKINAAFVVMAITVSSTVKAAPVQFGRVALLEGSNSVRAAADSTVELIRRNDAPNAASSNKFDLQGRNDRSDIGKIVNQADQSVDELSRTLLDTGQNQRLLKTRSSSIYSETISAAVEADRLARNVEIGYIPVDQPLDVAEKIMDLHRQGTQYAKQHMHETGDRWYKAMRKADMLNADRKDLSFWQWLAKRRLDTKLRETEKRSGESKTETLAAEHEYHRHLRHLEKLEESYKFLKDYKKWKAGQEELPKAQVAAHP